MPEFFVKSQYATEALEISYNEDGVSSSNSVADNKVVGLHIGNDNTKTSYQAEIINNTFKIFFLKISPCT